METEKFTAVVTPPGGREAFEVTPIADSVSFSTAAQGGFGSCALRVPLEQMRASDIPKLSEVRLQHDTHVLWEGRVEDAETDHVARVLSLDCFGYRRLLEDISVKRIWIMRAIPWQLVNSLAGTGKTFDPIAWSSSTIGRFDDADLARSGIRFSAQTGGAAAANDGHGAWYFTEAPLTRILFDYLKVGTDPINLAVYDSEDGDTWTSRLDVTPVNGVRVSANVALGAGAQFIRLVAYFNSGVAGANVAVEIDDIRLLGATQTEDILGALYPHTILRDLIAQIPDLDEGIIQNDTSFGLEAISRAQQRDKALSVVEEVTAYFRRRWAVWEEKRFDWRATALDEAHWALQLQDVSTCKIRSSIDNLARTIFIAYQHVATGRDEEQSAESTDQRNDYVRAGAAKHEVLVAPVGMTPNSALRLAQRLVEDHGSLPAVRGIIRLPAFTLVPNLTGTPQPACYIRAGENVLIPELPKDEHVNQGRDSQTLFNVVSTETDMSEDEQTTLSVDGYTRSSDILMSRLQSATRVLTG